MNKNNTILLFLFISGIMHLLILGVAWNLKQGYSGSFYFIPVILGSSYLVNIVFFLICAGMIKFSPKKPSLLPGEPPDVPQNKEKKFIPREFMDPKLSAEKLFKKLGQRSSILSFGKKLLSNISDDLEIIQGIFYVLNITRNTYEPIATYAISANHQDLDFKVGEGITGEAVKKKEITIVRNIPPDFRLIESGLGKRVPRFIYMVPFVFENRCLGLLELSTFIELTENKLYILNYCMFTGGEKLNQFLENLNEIQA